MISKRHKEILIELIPQIDTTKIYGTKLFLDNKYKGVLLESVKLYEFDTMYPHIILMMNHEGLIESLPDEWVRRLWNYLFNREGVKNSLSEEEFINERGWVNSLYGKLSSPKKSRLPGLLEKYTNLIYDDLLMDNPDNIIYIDCDIFFTKEEVKFRSPIPISCTEIPALLISEKKKYHYYDGIEIRLKGRYMPKDEEEILNKMRPIVRRSKIDGLGILD